MDEYTAQSAPLTVPPHSAEAERAILGLALKLPSSYAKVSEKLTAQDFYLPGHRAIFDTMQELHSKSSPVDVVTVVSELDAVGRLHEAGGASYISELPRAFITSANLDYYIDIVEAHSTRRKLIESANSISQDSFSGELSLTELLSSAEKRIFDISMKNVVSGLRPIGDDLLNVYLSASNVEATDGITGVGTGFTELDTKLSGFQRSDLIIVAGRPSMGKTAFAINIAQSASINGAVCAVFSLEMSREQLMARMLCSVAHVNMQLFRTGQLDDDMWSALAHAYERLGPIPFYIDDTGGISVAEIRTKLRRLKLERGRLDLVLIDYLQLMSYTGKSENRTQIVAEITRALKILARELDVPIVLLSQLSRAPEQRADHRPIMSDLRESGSIEQDADVIIMLYRAAAYDPDAGNEAVAIVAKHRNGPTGDVNLMWDPERVTYRSVSYRDE